MQNFAYLIGDTATREAVVIDAAWDIPTIIRTAEHDGFSITQALVTTTTRITLGEICSAPTSRA